jgi:hypothetical protein
MLPYFVKNSYTVLFCRVVNMVNNVFDTNASGHRVVGGRIKFSEKFFNKYVIGDRLLLVPLPQKASLPYEFHYHMFIWVAESEIVFDDFKLLLYCGIRA